MKFKILFLNLVSILTVDAQLSLVENQTFEGSMSGWTISPSASWSRRYQFVCGRSYILWSLVLLA